MSTAIPGASQGTFINVPSFDGKHVAGTSDNAINVNINQTSARMMIGPFVQTNSAASQSGVQISLGNTGASQLNAIMSRAGYVVAITVSFTVAPAGSDPVFTVLKNGSALDATAILTATAGSSLRRYVTFTPGLSALAFAAGDALGVSITTDGSFTATTTDVCVFIEVQTAL
jgi:hypothetical protein